MSRNFTYSALTLRVRPFGESNREAWFLTSGEGILKATVFGGPKSRLRARVAPFHGGTLWIYRDPVRDSRKVSDFDVTSYRTGLHELLERAMTAGAVAETILASYGGGGGWPEALSLAEGVLDVLDGADAAACSRTGIYFLWRWAGILGVKPELSACAACACEVKRDEIVWYSAGEAAVFCESCGRNIREGSAGEEGASPYGGEAADSWVKAGPGARLWLNRAETLSPSGMTRVSLDTVSLEQARTLSQTVLAGALGRKLPTWEGI